MSFFPEAQGQPSQIALCPAWIKFGYYKYDFQGRTVGRSWITDTYIN